MRIKYSSKSKGPSKASKKTASASGGIYKSSGAWGDYDNDGLFTVLDFLNLLSDYGCTNCPQGDLNSDGIVSVQDILIFLTWI